MDMEKNNLESVWADGVPQKINPEDVLPPKHILDMCIRFTLEQIIKDKGYKVLGVNDDLKKLSQYLIRKGKSTVCDCGSTMCLSEFHPKK